MKRIFKSFIALALFACASFAVATPVVPLYALPQFEVIAAPMAQVASDVITVDQIAFSEAKLSLASRDDEKRPFKSGSSDLFSATKQSLDVAGSNADRGAKIRRVEA